MAWIDDVRELEREYIRLIKTNGELKIRGRKKEGWSINDTARELNISVGKVSENLRLAKGLRKHPELSKMSERQDAITFMKIKGEW